MSKIVPVLYKERQFQVTAPEIPVGGITPELMLQQDASRQQQIANDQTRISKAMTTYADMMEQKRKHAREVGETVMNQLAETYELEGLTAGSAAFKDALDPSFTEIYNSIASGYNATEAMGEWRNKFAQGYAKNKTDEATTKAILTDLTEKNKKEGTLYQYDIAKLSGDVLLGNVDVNDLTGMSIMEKYRSADYSAIADQVRKECVEGKLSGKSKMESAPDTKTYDLNGQPIMTTTTYTNEQTLYDECPQHFIALTGEGIRKDVIQLMNAQQEGGWDGMTPLEQSKMLAHYADVILTKYYGPNDYAYNRGRDFKNDQTITKGPAPASGKNGSGGSKEKLLEYKTSYVQIGGLREMIQTANNNVEAKSGAQLLVQTTGIGPDAEGKFEAAADGLMSSNWNFLKGSDTEKEGPIINLGIDSNAGFNVGSVAGILFAPLMRMAGDTQFPIKYSKNSDMVGHSQEIEGIILGSNDGPTAAEGVIRYINSKPDLKELYNKTYKPNKGGKEVWEDKIRLDIQLEYGQLKSLIGDNRKISLGTLNAMFPDTEEKSYEALRDKIKENFDEQYSILSMPDNIYEAMFTKNNAVNGYSVRHTGGSENGFNIQNSVNSSAQYFASRFVGPARHRQMDTENAGTVSRNNVGDWSKTEGTPWNPYQTNPLMVNANEPTETKWQRYYDPKSIAESISKWYAESPEVITNDKKQVNLNTENL